MTPIKTKLRGFALRVLDAAPVLEAPLAGYHAMRRAARALAEPSAANHGLRRVLRGSIHFDLPDFRGQFELDARSHVTARILEAGCFEPERQAQSRVSCGRPRCDRRRRQRRLYSVLLAKLLHEDRRVLAVEPTPGR